MAHAKLNDVEMYDDSDRVVQSKCFTTSVYEILETGTDGEGGHDECIAAEEKVSLYFGATKEASEPP